ncbi:nucleic acid binding protein [Elderberry carlavirus E]|uniref:RNA silencing suppressor n=1 Tax=Elderberry carlavirus E TaxID=1569056 RepID=A0A0U4D3G9_9VIRU|nr:nucleic acid binding protein [Elderberry carlavirus E]ALY33534.1 nucleic acid binding protein [Elderberry carlavirus E]
MGRDRLTTLFLTIQACDAFIPMDLCVYILSKSKPPLCTGGSSTYARKRRARKIGRCWRCFRVSPPIFSSKCNGSTCEPGISYNWRVAEFINRGVTEVIPRM